MATGTSTPFRGGVTKSFDSDVSSILEPPKTVVKSSTVYEMVQQAIKKMGLPRKGASLQAIKKWITDNMECTAKTNALIKNAILKGLEDGTIARAKGSRECYGVTGSFMLVESSTRIPAKIKKAKTLPKDGENGDGGKAASSKIPVVKKAPKEPKKQEPKTAKVKDAVKPNKEKAGSSKSDAKDRKKADSKPKVIPPKRQVKKTVSNEVETIVDEVKRANKATTSRQPRAAKAETDTKVNQEEQKGRKKQNLKGKEPVSAPVSKVKKTKKTEKDEGTAPSSAEEDGEPKKTKKAQGKNTGTAVEGNPVQIKLPKKTKNKAATNLRKVASHESFLQDFDEKLDSGKEEEMEANRAKKALNLEPGSTFVHPTVSKLKKRTPRGKKNKKEKNAPHEHVSDGNDTV